jgi:hypothetical protein
MNNSSVARSSLSPPATCAANGSSAVSSPRLKRTVSKMDGFALMNPTNPKRPALHEPSSSQFLSHPPPPSSSSAAMPNRSVPPSAPVIPSLSIRLPKPASHLRSVPDVFKLSSRSVFTSSSSRPASNTAPFLPFLPTASTSTMQGPSTSLSTPHHPRESTHKSLPARPARGSHGGPNYQSANTESSVHPLPSLSDLRGD